MKYPVSCVFFLMFASSAVLPAQRAALDSVIFVSVGGNDSWSGSLPEPNAGKTDGPFASFERARHGVRSRLAAGVNPSVLA